MKDSSLLQMQALLLSEGKLCAVSDDDSTVSGQLQRGLTHCGIRGKRRTNYRLLVHGQVTIIFIMSVGLSVCLSVCYGRPM